MILTLDITGLTPEQIAEKDEAAFDFAVERQLECDELWLFDHGYPTEQEVADFLAMRRGILAEWKAECLAECRRGLSDWSAPSTKLQ